MFDVKTTRSEKAWWKERKLNYFNQKLINNALKRMMKKYLKFTMDTDRDVYCGWKSY